MLFFSGELKGSKLEVFKLLEKMSFSNYSRCPVVLEKPLASVALPVDPKRVAYPAVAGVVVPRDVLCPAKASELSDLSSSPLDSPPGNLPKAFHNVATDKDEYVITPGMIVFIPAGESHWHGATKDTPLAHVSIKTDGPTNF